MARHLDVEAARILVADSARFRTEVGAADQAEALLRVYRGAEEDPTRPFALVAMGRDAGLRRLAGTGHYLERQSTYILFESEVEAGQTLEEAYLEHTSWVGVVLQEMGVLAGSAGYVFLTEGELVHVRRSDLNESTQFHATVVELRR